MATALFGENHQRRLLATFEHVDAMLAEALANLTPREAGLLVPPCIADATPTQRRVIADHLARLRQVMRGFLDAQQIPLEAPRVSGMWGLRVALDLAQVALEEAEPKRLAGYGRLVPGAVKEIERLLAQLLPSCASFRTIWSAVWAATSRRVWRGSTRRGPRCPCCASWNGWSPPTASWTCAPPSTGWSSASSATSWTWPSSGG
jgi:hypothetical protein